MRSTVRFCVAPPELPPVFGLGRHLLKESLKMGTARRQFVSERGRDLGWSEDRDLLTEMGDQGWDPVGFSFDDEGVVIEFEQTQNGEPSNWNYDCNQEGGDTQVTIGILKDYAERHRQEMLFVFRTGARGAERNGGYTRFYSRSPREESDSWNPSFEYCGVIGSQIATGWNETDVKNPPTTHPRLWELIGIVRSLDMNDNTFTGRRLKIFKRKNH